MLNDLSFAFGTTITANTKRAGLTTGFAAYLYDIPCTRLAPLDAQTQQRLDLKTPHVTKQTFVQGDYDLKKGDLLVVDEIEYPIKYVEEWPWIDDDKRWMVVVEDLRN